MRRYFLFSLIFLAATAASDDPARAASGKAVGIDPDVTLIAGGASSLLKLGGTVVVGNTVTTSFGGEAQLLFEDGTRLVVGPSARLTVTALLLDSSQEQSFIIKATKGVFRFITGSLPTNAYKIVTPTGTMGIRGTAFDFAVRRNGRTFVMLLRGALEMCGNAGSCRSLTKSCQIAMTRGDGQARASTESDFLPRRNEVGSSFPYVRRQSHLVRGFQEPAARGCRGAAGSGPSGSGGGESPGGPGPGSGGRGGAAGNY